MKTLLSIFACLLLAASATAATTYSLVWDAPSPSDKLMFVKIYKKTGTTYALITSLLPTVLKWTIPNAVSGDVYAAAGTNAAGEGPKAEATVQGLPGKLNVRVLIEITP